MKSGMRLRSSGIAALVFAVVGFGASSGVAVLGCPNDRQAFPEGTPRHVILIDNELVWSGDELSESGGASAFLASDDIVDVQILCSVHVRNLFEVDTSSSAILIYTQDSGVQGIRDDLRTFAAAQHAYHNETGIWAQSLEELGWTGGSPDVTLVLEGAQEGAVGWRAVATHPAYYMSCAVGAGFGANPSRNTQADPAAHYCSILPRLGA